MITPFPAATRIKKKKQDFPGGAVDKNPPDNTESTGSIPGPGRFYMPQQLSPCTMPN